jgi:hypothetical protein
LGILSQVNSTYEIKINKLDGGEEYKRLLSMSQNFKSVGKFLMQSPPVPMRFWKPGFWCCLSPLRHISLQNQLKSNLPCWVVWNASGIPGCYAAFEWRSANYFGK